MNPDLQDEIYRIVGEEVARKEYHPGPMARAVAEAQGNRDLVQSLYIKCRYEELARQIERDTAEEQRRREQEQSRREQEQTRREQEQRRREQDQQRRQIAVERQAREKDALTCPKCGYRAKPKLTNQGNFLVLIILLCAYVIPGIIYALIFNGQKAVCANCGNILLKRV